MMNRMRKIPMKAFLMDYIYMYQRALEMGKYRMP